MPRPDDVLEITVAEMRAAIRKAKRAAYRKGEATATSFLKAVAKLNGSAAPLLKGMSDPAPAPTSDDATDPHAALYEALLAAVIDAREAGDDDAVAGLVDAYREHLDDPETLTAALAGAGSDDVVAKAIGRVLLKAGKYDESKHPRDDRGRYVSRDAIANAKGDPAKEEALRDKVTDPEQREKLDNALAGTTDLGRTKRGQQKHEAGQRREKRAASHARAAELADKIGSGTATPEDMHELGDHLEGLTVDKLRALQSRIPTAGRTRRKAEMVAALRDSLEKSAHMKRVTDGAGGATGVVAESPSTKRTVEMPNEEPATGQHESAGAALMAGRSFADWQNATLQRAYDDDGKVADPAAVAALNSMDAAQYIRNQEIAGKPVVADSGRKVGVVTGFTPDLRFATVRHDDGTESTLHADGLNSLTGHVKHELDKDKNGKLKPDVLNHFARVVAKDAHESGRNISDVLRDKGIDPAKAMSVRGAIAAEVDRLKESAKPQPSPELAAARERAKQREAAPAEPPAEVDPGHAADIDRARKADKQFRGEGRYEAETWEKLRAKNPGAKLPLLSRDAAEWIADGADRDGKPVPPEVLADYPDLTPKPAAPQPPAGGSAPGGGKGPGVSDAENEGTVAKPGAAVDPWSVRMLTPGEVGAKDAPWAEHSVHATHEAAAAAAGTGGAVMMRPGSRTIDTHYDVTGYGVAVPEWVAYQPRGSTPADPATAHAATLPEGSPARAAIEAAVANGNGDKRRTLKELGHRHAEMAAQMSPEEERGYVEMMAAHGVKPLHEPGQTVPFDPETMHSDVGVSTGTPVKVTRRGWTGLYGDARVGHENIGNNVQRAMVEPAGGTNEQALAKQFDARLRDELQAAGHGNVQIVHNPKGSKLAPGSPPAAVALRDRLLNDYAKAYHEAGGPRATPEQLAAKLATVGKDRPAPASVAAPANDLDGLLTEAEPAKRLAQAGAVLGRAKYQGGLTPSQEAALRAEHGRLYDAVHSQPSAPPSSATAKPTAAGAVAADRPELADWLDAEWSNIPKQQRKKLNPDKWNAEKAAEYNAALAPAASATAGTPAPEAKPVAGKPGNSPQSGQATLDNGKGTGDTTPVPATPAGGGGAKMQRVKVPVVAGSKESHVEVDLPELVTNTAGAVEFGRSSARVNVTPDAAMRAAGITSVKSAVRRGEVVEAETNRGRVNIKLDSRPELRRLFESAEAANDAVNNARAAWHATDPHARAIAESVAETNRGYQQEADAREVRRAAGEAARAAAEDTPEARAAEAHARRWARATNDPNGSY